MESFAIFTMMMITTMALSFLFGFDLRSYMEEEKEKKRLEEFRNRTEREVRKNLKMTMDTFCNFHIE